MSKDNKRNHEAQLSRFMVPKRRSCSKSTEAVARHTPFAMAVLLSFALFRSPLKELLQASLHDEAHAHVLFMPVLAGCFLYWKRDFIFSGVGRSLRIGAALIGIGIILWYLDAAAAFSLRRNDHLSLSILSVFLVWTGAFICCYGLVTFKRALFAFSLLLIIIPVPTFLSGLIVPFLQTCTAETVHRLLLLLGLPVAKEGFVFHFPKMSIRIAEQCSGFQSLVALLITTMIAARLFLSKGWTRAIALISIVPITVAKNTLRIVILSLIIAHMGENAFVHAYHRFVGFSTIAVLLLWPVVMSLKRLEPKTPVGSSGSTS
jgi:exosortase